MAVHTLREHQPVGASCGDTLWVVLFVVILQASRFPALRIVIVHKTRNESSSRKECCANAGMFPSAEAAPNAVLSKA